MCFSICVVCTHQSLVEKYFPGLLISVHLSLGHALVEEHLNQWVVGAVFILQTSNSASACTWQHRNGEPRNGLGGKTRGSFPRCSTFDPILIFFLFQIAKKENNKINTLIVPAQVNQDKMQGKRMILSVVLCREDENNHSSYLKSELDKRLLDNLSSRRVACDGNVPVVCRHAVVVQFAETKVHSWEPRIIRKTWLCKSFYKTLQSNSFCCQVFLKANSTFGVGTQVCQLLILRSFFAEEKDWPGSNRAREQWRLYASTAISCHLRSECSVSKVQWFLRKANLCWRVLSVPTSDCQGRCGCSLGPGPSLCSAGRWTVASRLGTAAACAEAAHCWSAVRHPLQTGQSANQNPVPINYFTHVCMVKLEFIFLWNDVVVATTLQITSWWTGQTSLSKNLGRSLGTDLCRWLQPCNNLQGHQIYDRFSRLLPAKDIGNNTGSVMESVKQTTHLFDLIFWDLLWISELLSTN